MSYLIKELPISERPRERLKKVGANNLSDKELLAIILKTGTKNRNVKELSVFGSICRKNSYPEKTWN